MNTLATIRGVPRYLMAAGHYEFGPQRVPIRLSHEAGDRIREAWQRGDDDAGYAVQWADIYRFVDRLRSDAKGLAERILVVRYEDFCDGPHEVVSDILRHANLTSDATIEPQAFGHIALPVCGASDLPDGFRETVWRETGAVAKLFGYAAADDAVRRAKDARKDLAAASQHYRQEGAAQASARSSSRRHIEAARKPLQPLFGDQIRESRHGRGSPVQLLDIDRFNSIASGVVEVEVVC